LIQKTIQKALLTLAVLALSCFTLTARAQVTALDKQLARIDFAISGAGEFHSTASGPVTASFSSNTGQTISIQPSTTFGGLATLRYIKSPLIGFEGNYTYARYTDNFSNIGGVQTNAAEMTVGYVITPAHTLFGFQPFASIGAGAVEFKPTPRGGLGLPKQAVSAYYYSVGLQQEYLASHFGLRASFRQVLLNAPDYYQNYLTIQKRTITTQPTIGFYVRF
jgi:hypothetical protein